MKKKINDILIEFQTNKICIGDAANELKKLLKKKKNAQESKAFHLGIVREAYKTQKAFTLGILRKGHANVDFDKTQLEDAMREFYLRSSYSFTKDQKENPFPASGGYVDGVKVDENENANLNAILEMLHEFRNWNQKWDSYFAKDPQSVDTFVKMLSTKYTVIKK